MTKKMKDYYNIPLRVEKEVNEYETVTYALIDAVGEKVGVYPYDEKETADAMAEFVNSHDELVEQLKKHQSPIGDTLFTNQGESYCLLGSANDKIDKLVADLKSKNDVIRDATTALNGCKDEMDTAGYDSANDAYRGLEEILADIQALEEKKT